MTDQGQEGTGQDSKDVDLYDEPDTFEPRSEREAMLERARAPRPADALAAEQASRLREEQQAAALEALLKTPEWKVYAQLARAEQESYEFKAMDPNELLQGIVTKRVPGLAPEGPTAGNPAASATVVQPVDGTAWVLKRTFLQGAAWGAHSALTFPDRFVESLRRKQALRMKTARVIVGADGKPVRTPAAR